MSPSATASASPPVSAFLSSKNKWQLWHHKQGHPSDRVLVSAMPSLCSCMSVSNKHVQHHCKHCLISKMHRLPFTHSQFQSTQPLELVHSDAWGPAPVNSCNGYKYYLLFVDDFSRFSWLFLLKSKSEVLNTFKHSKQQLKINYLTTLSFLELIVVESILQMPSLIFVPLKALPISFHVPILLNRMALLKESIDISLRVLSLFSLMLAYQLPNGLMLLLLPYTS
jgi:hypothetical protein